MLARSLATTARRYLLPTSEESTCHKCNHKQPKYVLFCQNVACRTVQRIEREGCDFFRLFGLPYRYEMLPPTHVDELDDAYKNLMNQLHPDRFVNKSEEEKLISVANSTLVNIGNKTLQDNVQRAGHMLALNNQTNPLEEDVKADDPDLLEKLYHYRDEMEMKSWDYEYMEVVSLRYHEDLK
jgi:hypothetical protein